MATCPIVQALIDLSIRSGLQWKTAVYIAFVSVADKRLLIKIRFFFLVHGKGKQGRKYGES